MTTEKICFRYDGSPEAKQAMKWVNERNETFYIGFADKYYTFNGKHFIEQPINYRLVPPAEFLRIVKGESEWQPKYGEEVEVSDDGEDWLKRKFLCYTSHGKPVVEVSEGGAVRYEHIRPVRKSLREEIIYLAEMYDFSPFLVYQIGLIGISPLLSMFTFFMLLFILSTVIARCVAV